VLAWYAALSMLFVASVFRSTGIDYRLIALGSLLPLAVDLGFGSRAYGHTLLFAAVLLVAVMLGTIGRGRLLRRRLLCVPIGVLCGLVLSGAFTNDRLFWWPFLGRSFPHDPLVGSPWLVAAQELAGLLALWWFVGSYDLYLPGPRRTLWRTGRLAPPRSPPGGGEG
jgi:hypothetical protein